MLGDSMTAFGEWSALLPDATIANRGIGGDTTLGMRAGSVVRPAAVFVMAGINDLRRRHRSVDETFDTYRSVIGGILRSGSRVVVQSTLFVMLRGRDDLNDSVGRLNARLRHYCGTQDGCEFVDLNPALSPGGRLASAYTVDGVQLNGAGYLRWSAEITTIVGRIAAQRSASPRH
ncbi:GDSL-type esterase/lipase family protein [Cupriavidus necator]|uniref:GDSL-type esterase/lipase family protein n=1 Tax=Cupriavidus necator TaxID=106590 RepID=UPI0012D2FD1C|nr:GDSL-type esterase/lipase family protein [Cupriavidus necator]